MKIRSLFRIEILPVLLLLIGILLVALSAFLFTLLDQVVHGDLYRHGLQFSYEWAERYWTYSKLLLGILGAVIAMNGAVATFLLFGVHPKKIYSPKLVCWLLTFLGGVALVLSINYNSLVLAFIGLGLVFWGAIILYIRPEAYVKENLLSTTALPPIENLSQIIKELGYEGKGIYLPPKYLPEFESSKVYISTQKGLQLPTPEQIQQQQEGLFLKEPSGILLTPLGAELTRLFERTLGRSFTIVNLQFIKLNMPKLFVEDLEIAQNFEMEAENSKVRVKIEGLVYKDIYKEAKRTPYIHTLDQPISSAIACALAKATGKPIVIEEERTSEDGKTIEIEYSLLEETRQ